MRVNNTGRIVFNKEAAERLERLGRPTPLTVMTEGDIIRLLSRTTDEASAKTLEVTYDKGAPYVAEAQLFPLLEPLGFQPGKGRPSYPIYPKYIDHGFEFRFPPEEPRHA